MVTALNVANTFLNKGFECDIDISPMKLQKLIFILYKEYLKETGMPLFHERFETWKYGPVIRDVYSAFSGNRSNAIRDYYRDIDGVVYIVDIRGGSVIAKVFDRVWEKYKNYSGEVLSMFTHRRGTAWSKAKEKNSWCLNNEDIEAEEDYV